MNGLAGLKNQEKPRDDAEDIVDVEFSKLLGDDPCVSRPSNKPLHGLRIVRPRFPDKIVEYFGIDGEGDATSIKFITGGHRIWEVTITGRNLSRLLGYLKEHRIDWIRQADRGFGADKELLIEGISMRLVPADQLGKA